MGEHPDDERPPRAVQIHRFVDLATSTLTLAPSCGPVRIVAIDGPGGAGKSTFAGRLSRALGGARVIHTDDFASWDNQFDWADRLLSQVLEPLSAGQAGRYQRYDWVARRFAEWHDVAVAAALVIEGVGAARREFESFLAYRIWIDTPQELRLARGIERDGEALRDFWMQWIDGENRHFAQDRTRERIDLVASGNPSAPHDPEAEYLGC